MLKSERGVSIMFVLCTMTSICPPHHNNNSHKKLIISKPAANPNFITHVTTNHNHNINGDDDDFNGDDSAAAAVSSAIRIASTASPVQFTLNSDNNNNNDKLPSHDFHSLVVDQLDLFRRIVHRNALLQVYVRPAGTYVMDRLELRRVTLNHHRHTLILIATFTLPTGLRVTEAALSNLQVQLIPEHRAFVFPMLKHPFIVGFLVAQLPEDTYSLPSNSHVNSSEIQPFEDDPLFNLTADQRLNAIHIARTLAMAYVMDQKAMLLQQTSWQNNVRMNNLVDQIRGPLSSIRTLSRMLTTHLKRSEISHDIAEDILVQGDRIKETLQQLQDVVYLTKANIMRYNEETLKKIHPSSARSQLSDNFERHSSDSKMQNSGEPLFLASSAMDLEMPMPPVSLPRLLLKNIRPCNVSDVLADLVEAARPLALKQKRVVELRELCQSLQVGVNEPALRQALSNLIEGALLRTHVGGKVEVVSTSTPAGGTLVVIDDDGPDMHYMTQMHSLTPFGADLLSDDMGEDNIWNYVAGLTVAREIVESYGCVIRVISPRITDAVLGAGGTRIELWLPSSTVSDENDISAG